jgi:hypothetical protein
MLWILPVVSTVIEPMYLYVDYQYFKNYNGTPIVPTN